MKKFQKVYPSSAGGVLSVQQQQGGGYVASVGQPQAQQQQQQQQQAMVFALEFEKKFIYWPNHNLSNNRNSSNRPSSSKPTRGQRSTTRPKSIPGRLEWKGSGKPKKENQTREVKWGESIASFYSIIILNWLPIQR